MYHNGLYPGCAYHAEDAVRFEREMTEFKQQHPSWVGPKKGAKRVSRAATRPRKPLTAFMAFLQSKLSEGAADEPVKAKASILD